jgi:hypothetical protein
MQRSFSRHIPPDQQSKENIMKMLRKNVLIALAALSMGAAYAGEAPATAPQQQSKAKMAERHAKMAQHRAEREAKLHDALKLSPQQEPAWNSFAASMKPAERGQHPDRAAWASLSAPQRMEKMIELHKQRTTMMESRLAALNTFYGTLTPEQKKVFDQQTLRGPGFHGGHREHGKMQG